MASFVQVIFPLALPKLYSYAVPDEWADIIQVGVRVEVSLKNKLYSGIVAEVSIDPVLKFKAKPIIAILDKEPIINSLQLQFWKWLAKYYCCSLGEVMNVAMPSGLKLESETKIITHPDFDENFSDLTDDEYLVAEAISIQNELTITQIQEILNKKTIYPIIRSLLDKRVINVKEELIKKFKPRMINFLTLHPSYHNDFNLLSQAFDLVKNSEKQTNALLVFVQLSKNKIFKFPVSEICNRANVDTSVIKAMEKKDIFIITKENQSRIFSKTIEETESLASLNDFQKEAIIKIKSFFEDSKPVLLHGITGSGKTRVYSELIQETIAQEKQCLYLLPEIALTTHMVDRLKTTFGSDILVYHSRMNNQERVEMWNAVLGGTKIVIAARSGLFLPFVNLGLIIVDEEHDPSFKQNDPNPRYNARDTAIYLSSISQANIILGSATPSLESYHNVSQQKYGLVNLPERYGDSILPIIEVVDLKKERNDQRFKGLFSQSLIENINTCLINKEQILIFQNRRGYSPTVSCQLCGWKAECQNCDVRLTLHKAFKELRCHYCGSRSKEPIHCPACGHDDLCEEGFGTEQIEEHMKELFPDANIARLDLDTAKTKLAFESILHDFEDKKIDILVGTQMITKGLDFDNILLVGVLNADALLRYPDLRANERAFQLLTQVSGRAGRRGKQGKVIIQTYAPEHPVIFETTNYLYNTFVDRESDERKAFVYPPFYRMIQIEFLHKKSDVVAHAAKVYADLVKKVIGNRLMGPAIPSIGRIRGQYIQTITIKMEKDPKIVNKVKTLIIETKSKLKQIPNIKTVRVNIDVDPY